jgi:hypothetical protein
MKKNGVENRKNFHKSFDIYFPYFFHGIDYFFCIDEEKQKRCIDNLWISGAFD